MLGLAAIEEGVGRWLGRSLYEQVPSYGRWPWGEGLVDQSLTTFLYPATWREIGDDELVWLVPSLADELTPLAQARLSGPLLEAITSRLGHLAAWATHSSRRLPSSVPDMALALRSGGILSPGVTKRVVTCALADDRPRRRARSPLSKLFAGTRGAGTRGDSSLVAELSIVSCLDGLLLRVLDASGDREIAAGAAAPPLEPADVLVASIVGGFNGAYVATELACHHELFTIGAWIGQLARGRKAWLPPEFASRLASELGNGAAARGEPVDACAGIILAAAEAAIGARKLTRIARAVERQGNPRIAAPRLLPHFHDPNWPRWNEVRHARIARQAGALHLISRTRGDDAPNRKS